MPTNDEIHGAWTQHATLYVSGSSYEPDDPKPTWLTADTLWSASPNAAHG